MTGPQESRDSVDSRMDKINEALNNYEKSTGLPILSPPGTQSELEMYLNQERSTTESLSASECGSLSFRLQQYAFHIQRCINLEKSRSLWANALLKETTSKYLNNYDSYTKYEVKVSLICQENAFASKLQKIINYAEQRIARLDSLAYSLQAMAKTVGDIQRAKISEIYAEKE